jgi:hypothetical protein
VELSLQPLALLCILGIPFFNLPLYQCWEPWSSAQVERQVGTVGEGKDLVPDVDAMIGRWPPAA